MPSRVSRLVFILSCVIFCAVVFAPSFSFSQVQEFDTAISHIGIPPFSGEETSPETPTLRLKLRDRILAEIEGKTSVKTSPLSLPLQQAEIKKVGIDGILAGQVFGARLRLTLANSRGKALMIWTAKFPDLTNSEALDAIASEIVFSLVERIPYLGYVTKIRGNSVDVNIGSANGIEKGSKLFVFLLPGVKPSFHNQRKKIAQIQISSVKGPSLSEAKVLNKTQAIPLFAKVDFKIPEVLAEEPPMIIPQPSSAKPPPPKNPAPAPPESVEKTEVPPPTETPAETSTERPPTKKAFPKDTKRRARPAPNTRYGENWWLYLGGGLNSMETVISTYSYIDKDYELKSAPLFSIGVGYGPLAIQGSYSTIQQADHDSNAIELLATYEVLTFGYESWQILGSAGVFLQRLAATNKIPPNLGSLQIGSPLAELRTYFRLARQSRLFAGAHLYYPVLATDQQGFTPLSVGGAGFLGIQQGLTENLYADIEFRYRYLRVEMQGSSGFQQRTAQLEAKLMWFF